MKPPPTNLTELAGFRGREEVFADRRHAGRVLSEMLCDRLEPHSVVLAVPAGGVPVACALIDALADDQDLAIDVVVVSKITFPWNSEAGYGAVAENGRVRLNDRILAQVRLSEAEIEDGIRATTARVERRVRRFGGHGGGAPGIQGRPVVIVDDGLASGTTMGAAIEAVAQRAPAAITLAVPTGHMDAIRRLAGKVAQVYCANVRGGMRFAVAAAYRHWSDVTETVAVDMMSRRCRPA